MVCCSFIEKFSGSETSKFHLATVLSLPPENIKFSLSALAIVYKGPVCPECFIYREVTVFMMGLQ